MTSVLFATKWKCINFSIKYCLIISASNIDDLIRYTLWCPLNCKYYCKKCSHEFKAAKQFIKYKFTPTFNDWLRPVIQPQKSHLFCLTQFIHYNLLLHVISICKIVYAKKRFLWQFCVGFRNFFLLNEFNISSYVHDVNYVVNKMKLQYIYFYFIFCMFCNGMLTYWTDNLNSLFCY